MAAHALADAVANMLSDDKVQLYFVISYKCLCDRLAQEMKRGIYESLRDIKDMNEQLVAIDARPKSYPFEAYRAVGSAHPRIP